MSDTERLTVAGVLGWKQPAVTADQVRRSSGALLRYRIMAFVTGVVLISACVLLILKYGTSVNVEPEEGYVWIAHGWLFLVYVIVTALLGLRLRWPLARYALVMVSGTIPTMSFVAEHFVTRATKQAGTRQPKAQPVDARD